jgi:catalase
MRFDGNGGAAPNYEPNSAGIAIEKGGVDEPPLRISGDVARYDHRIGNDDYVQAGALFRLIGREAQLRLLDNIGRSLGQAPVDSQQRQIEHFMRADRAYGEGVAERLKQTEKSPA